MSVALWEAGVRVRTAIPQVLEAGVNGVDSIVELVISGVIIVDVRINNEMPLRGTRNVDV